MLRATLGKSSDPEIWDGIVWTDGPEDAGSAEPLETIGTVCLLILEKREDFSIC